MAKKINHYEQFWQRDRAAPNHFACEVIRRLWKGFGRATAGRRLRRVAFLVAPRSWSRRVPGRAAFLVAPVPGRAAFLVVPRSWSCRVPGRAAFLAAPRSSLRREVAVVGGASLSGGGGVA
jgi:hypothetical protein